VAGVVLVCVAEGEGAVTVCAGAVTVLVGAVTVVVWVGFGDATLTPRLLVVDVVCWFTTVEGDLDLLFEATTPASTPRTMSAAMSGHIHPPCFFGEGVS
jgi:hypothetical protein